LGPAALVLLVFDILPIFYAVFISLFNWRVVQGAFVGLGNYTRAFAQEDFWRSIGVTVFYVIGTVPLSIFISFILAYLLFQKIRGRGVYRVLYFLPYITSLVAVALVWKWIYHPDYGLLNWMFGWFGAPPARWLLEPLGVFQLAARSLGTDLPALLAGPSLALVAIVIFAIWHALGFDVVVLLAGLSNIDTELYDAAKLDGAGGWSLMRHITAPLLSPTLFFLSTVSIIRSFQAFIPIYVMTNGHPLGTTETITVYIFHNFYEFTRLGYGAAVAMILFGLILVLTLLQIRVAGRRVHY
jgi:multiple sugar transport system permease protein